MLKRGWSGGAMVLGKLPVPGRPTIWMIVGQGPIVLAVGAGGGCLDIFTLVCRVPKCPTALNVRQISFFSKSVILVTKININSKISKYFKRIISEKYSDRT